MKRIKRAISYIIAFIIAALYTITGIPVLSEKTEPVQAALPPGYHTGDLTKIYNIVKFDDQSDFSSYTKYYNEATGSRFIFPFFKHCGQCESQWGAGSHMIWQAANFYGYYDEVYNNWVWTGVHVYGGLSNVLVTVCCDPTEHHISNSGNPIHGCGHKHDRYNNSEDIPYTNPDIDSVASWFFSNNPDWYGNEPIPICSMKGIRDDGHSFSFSTEAGVGGTVSVTYNNVEVPNTYTVKYDSNGGTGTVASQSCTYDTAFNLQSSSLTRSGYIFTGWNTEANGSGTSYSEGQSVSNLTLTNGGTVTLYAQWIADTFTQKLNFYKGSTLFDTRTYDVKNGETFSAYDHRLDAGTPDNYHYSSVSETSWTVSAAKSADVKFAINQMKVVYDGNGNTGGSTSDAYVDYNTNLTVASNGFSKTNFHFVKWNTKADGTGVSCHAGNTILMQPSTHGQEYRLYAQWERDMHNQSINYYRYEYNNGTWGWTYDKTKTYPAGAGLIFDAESSAKTETVSGYYYDHVITKSWTVTGTSSTDAYFIPNTYNVSYNGNGATSGSMDDTTGCTYSVPFTLGNNGYSRTYYTFNGWNTQPDGSGTSYGNGAAAKNLTTINNGTAVLYAKWLDTTSPTLTLTDAGTQGSWVRYTGVKLTAADNGDGLAADCVYQYCLSQNTSAPEGSAEWKTYTNGVSFSIGAGLTGTFYMYVKPVTDKVGNKSTSTYHKYGPYLFDNSAPADNIQSVYGWYESATEIDFGIHDDYSGIKSVVIKNFYGIQLADITASGKYTFDTDGENFYSITLTDMLDNTVTKVFMVKLSKYKEVIPKNAVWKGLSDLRIYGHWKPITYSIVFDGNGATSGSTAAMTGLVYDRSYSLNANGFAREHYSFDGWDTEADGTGLKYADRQTVSNLSSTQGDVVTLYARWVDTSAPRLNVSPSSCSDIVQNLDIIITITETGSGLDNSNLYEYGLSTSSAVPPDTWVSYRNGTVPENGFSEVVNIGSGLDGTYYLWLKQVKDNYGNTSASDTCTDVEYIGRTYHVCGPYTFDNTAPDGNVTYVENNITLGLYNDAITDSPYAVMTVYGARDNLSGIKNISLEIYDAADAGNRTVLAFTENGSTYTCTFDLYNSLSNPQDIEKVRLRILASDNAGNIGSLPITAYDFGVLQTGRPIEADCIGYRAVTKSDGNTGIHGSIISSFNEYVYERDAFRVEAYIDNTSYHSAGTTFMGGHFGQLRIYTFGYVDIISADFGSLRDFIKPDYDTDPNLSPTDIPVLNSTHMYTHIFKIPLYCEPSYFTDTTVYGYKNGCFETRNVEYEVSDKIINHIKTILKYNVR